MYCKSDCNLILIFNGYSMGKLKGVLNGADSWEGHSNKALLLGSSVNISLREMKTSCGSVLSERICLQLV